MWYCRTMEPQNQKDRVGNNESSENEILLSLNNYPYPRDLSFGHYVLGRLELCESIENNVLPLEESSLFFV